MTQRRRRWRRHFRLSMAGLASITLAAGLALSATPASAAPSTEPEPGNAEVDRQVRAELEANGSTDFWVYLRERADLSAAESMADRAAQGRYAYEQLTETAQASQAGLRELLDAQEAEYQSFWLANTVKVTGDQQLLEQITALPEVEQVTADHTYHLPEPISADAEPRVQAVEWGIDEINAPDVWDTFGVRGEGIVVGTVDSGALYTHEAIVGQYRGNLGGGEFDHNYNWWDPSNVCGSPSLEPCDNTGHGTHVAGTMVGDDGAGNQIGVAPGAQWIAAKGCESSTCSQAALLSAGQFIFAPTDLEGENEDPARRPHIVNNSWGGGATDDPWYVQTVDNWISAGIFPQFANGNTDFGTAPCGSASNPGNLASTYSAGAYDSSGTLAAFSNRGPSAWDDELIKPNIAAPGVAVRSSWNDGDYNAISGTSMASPHVAGAVALMWSASEALLRNIDATRDLLDQTAVDTEELTCGGTAENNNMFGQGKLDAFAAVEQSPRGPVGVLAGTVTDDGSSDPIEGATVTVTGEVDREVTTNADGDYSVVLPVGQFDASAAAFGYEPGDAAVTIAEDQTTTQDFALSEADNVTIGGTVTDGSGHGWPMHARIDVVDTPVATHTDPATGEFSLSVPAGATYTLQVDSQYPGYDALTETVEADGADVTLDLSMTVDPLACNVAPGYEIDQPRMAMVTSDSGGGQFADYVAGRGVEVDFFTAAQLDQITGYDVVLWGYNFSVVDEDTFQSFLDRTDSEGTGVVFLDHAFTTWNGIKTLSNLTGNPVSVETNTSGSGQQNLYEVTEEHPILDGYSVGDQIVHEPEQTAWLAWFEGYEGDGRQVIADVGRTGDGILGSGIGVQERDNNRHALLSVHASSSTRGPSDWSDDSAQLFWNAINWVSPGDSSFQCLKVEGGLVVGEVTDRNTGDAVSGATVASVPNPAESGRTDDGSYWLFSSQTGSTEFTASAGGYTDETGTVDVAADSATEADFSLAAGQLEVSPSEVDAELRLGNAAERSFTISNTGTAPAEVEFSERGGDFEILNVDGTTDPVSPLATMGPGAPLQRIEGPVSDQSAAVADLGPGTAAPSQTPSQEQWQDIASLPFPVMDNIVDTWDGMVYSISGIDNASNWHDATLRYEPAGDGWEQMAPIPTPREKPNGAIIDGKFYVVGGWDSTGGMVSAMEIYDIASDSWSTGAPIPTAYAGSGSAVVDGKLYLIGGCQNACGSTDVWVYDPAADSWSEAASYPQMSSWTHCGGIDGLIYCAGSSQGAGDGAYVYHPDADQWSPIASMPATVWGGGYAAANGMLLVSGGVVDGTISNQGFGYDPASDSWEPLPNAGNALYRGGAACGFYRVGGSEFQFAAVPAAEVLPGLDECGRVVDLPWLEVDTTTATIAPGDSVEVTVSMDSDATEEGQPGAYSAGIGVSHDTPYQVPAVGVTMNVTPPNDWGKITGTVTGVTCEGDEAPLAGAIVQLDGSRQQVTLRTGGEGGYAYWLPLRNNPLTMIVATGEHVPQTRETRIRPRHTVVEDFALSEICASQMTGSQRPI